MSSRGLQGYWSFGVSVLLLTLLSFAVISWLKIPAAAVIDWVVGIASFAWLVVIVTVPWSVYFQAREVVSEAAISRQRLIPVREEQVEFARRVAFWSLRIAILLHLISAVGLFCLAYFGISAVGYTSSGAALLLTILRPAVRAYEFIAARLSQVKQEVAYPREDVVTLKQRVQQLEGMLNLQDQHSWASEIVEQANTDRQAAQRGLHAARQQEAHLTAQLEQWKATNQLEHDRLSQEAKTAIAQLSADSQFLDHVREIIRFFKSA